MIIRSDLCLVTLCIGSRHQKMGDFAMPMLKNYATKCKADFVVFNDRTLGKGMELYEKYRVFELFEKYKRILLIDIDVVIAPFCPDIFKIVPESHVGAFVVSKFTNNHDKAIEKIQSVLGQIPWANGNDYFNAGVLVISKRHQKLFNRLSKNYKIWTSCSRIDAFLEQTLLNYEIQRKKVPVYDFGFKFNHTTAPKNSYERFSSYIVHYPGKGHRKGFRLRQMKIDNFIFNHKTLLKFCQKHSKFNRLFDTII